MDRKLIECMQDLQARSHLVTVRKKNVEELQNLLLRKEIIQLINETSENDPESNVSWSNIFIVAHSVLLKEIDKLASDSSKSKSRVTSDLSRNIQTASLISVVVEKANSDVSYLDCSTIIDASIQILRKIPHKALVGHIYEGILRRYVLSVEKCWYQLKNEMWEDLFELTKELLDDPPTRSSMSSIVQMMNLIVLRGCEQRPFINVLKKEKIFILLEKIVHKSVTEKKVDFQYSALSLVVTVCQKLQKECRMAICKFGEGILQKILNMYESKGESAHKKTRKIIDFLLIQMEAHHPDGVDENSDKAYAYNWESWKISLKQLNFITIREIAVLQRQGTVTENFLKLVVEVYNQTFRMNITSVNITIDYTLNETSLSSDQPASKKRRINCGFPDIIERLGISAKPIDMWPWLAVLSSLMKTYPKLVSPSDYSLILQNMQTLLSASKEPKVTDYLYRCCVALIGVRQNLKSKDIKSDEESWKSIWNLVLRTIGLNQNVQSSHTLLRCMMNNMWKPTMGNAVLTLYLSHVVQFSEDSLLTLYALQERKAFANSIHDIIVHTSLLRWLIPSTDVAITSRDLSELPLDVYAHVTFSCCLKNNVQKTQTRIPLLNIKDDLHSDYSLPVSTVHSLHSYDSDVLLRFSNCQKIDAVEKELHNFSLNAEAFEQLSNFIDENCESMFELCNSAADRISLLRQLGLYFMFLVHILKFKNNYAVELNAARIELLVQSLLTRLTLLLDEILTPQQNEKKLLKCLTYLADFFQQLGGAPANIVHSILETIFPQLQYICHVFELGFPKKEQEDDMECDVLSMNEEEYQSVFNSKILSTSDQIRFEACRVLVHYSYHHDSICISQQNILNAVLDVLETVEEKQRTKCFLQMAVYACFAALKIPNLDSSVFEGITRVIQTLCETKDWSQTEESAIIILKLIRRGFQVVHADHAYGWNHLNLLLNRMTQILTKSGTRTVVEIVQCYGFFTNTKIGRYCLDTGRPVSLKCEKILPYLKDPSHEIRITAVSFLCKVFCTVDHFVSYEDVNLDYDVFIENFVKMLRDCFTVDDSLLDDIDEMVNRPITVLYALVCAICSSSVGRRKFMFQFFDIIREKRVNEDLGRKVLHIARDHFKLSDVLHLVKDNFQFVSWCWFKKHNTFENFPYEVVLCKSLQEFSTLFLRDIVVVLLFYGKVEMIISLCTTIIESSVREVVLNCFPEVMSLMFIKVNNDAGSEGITATDLHSLIDRLMGMTAIEQEIPPRLPEIIVSILRNLHDLRFEIPNGSILPTPTVFVADKGKIEASLASLQIDTGAAEPSLVIHLAKNFREYIQKVYQRLYIDVMNSSTPEVKLAAFQRYILFCQMLLPYYKNLLHYKMVVFITRTVLCNVLNFISSDDDYASLSLAALKFLRTFIQQWVSDDSEYEKSTAVFKKHLSSIVDKLVPLASRKDDLGEAALEVMQCFLIDLSECLFDAICKLDQLPDLPEFEPFRNSYLQEQETQMQDSSLTNDIEQFLSASKFSPHSPCRAETLKFLRKQLSLQKPELFRMFEGIGNKQLFSEDCLASVPHRFILALLRSIDLRDPKVSYEAVCCLSEIGLVDLQTSVLQPSHDIASSVALAEGLIVEMLCQQLIECIVDENVDVVNVSCEVLKQILLSETGYSIVSEDNCSFDRLLVHPFIPSSINEVDCLSLWQHFQYRKFQDDVDKESLWIPVQDISHETWVTNLVCAILNSFDKKCFLNALQAVCRLKVTVSETILKYLVYLLTDDEFGESKKILGARINQFFESSFVSNKTDEYDSYSSNHSSTEKVTAIFCNKYSVRCLLDVVHFVRLRQRDPNVNHLEINYLYAAKAAQYCSAFFTSLLYGELWMNSLIQNSDVEYDGNVTSFLEKVEESLPDIDPNELLNILRQAFSEIDDSDALFGCGSSILIHPETRIRHYRQVENWNRVVESCDLQLTMNFNSFTHINDLASALEFSGCSYLQSHYISSLNQNQLNPRLIDGSYKSGWKLAKWDLEEPMDDCKTFNYYQYAALKDFHQRNFDGVRVNIMNARQCIVPSLTKAVFESTKNMYNVMNKLQCLQDIEDIISANCLETVLERWANHDDLGTNLSFSQKEVILNQRVCLIDSTSAEGREFVLNIAKTARKEGEFTFADTWLAIARRNEDDLSALFKLKVRFEEARVLWDRKERYEARYILKNLQKEAVRVDPILFSSILRTHGKWLAEIKAENDHTILDNYFMMAATFTEDSVDSEKDRKNRLKTFKCLARFADEQYHELSEYTKSDEFEEQMKSVTESKRESDALGDQNRRTKVTLANQSRIEDSKVKDVKNRKQTYLLLAMRYYLKILAEGTEEDLKVFRVVSFWLHNKDDTNLREEVRKMLFQIPSYKFVPVLPQLVAHISSAADVFGNLLNELIERCIVDHPHHTLPLILSLANYAKDQLYENNKKAAEEVMKKESVVAASALVSKFRLNRKVGKILGEMELLSNAYIQFAYTKTKKTNAGEISSIPPKCAILKIANFENINCPTITLPVSKTAVYSDIIGIRRIEPHFSTACGVNAPKRIACQGTDGLRRYQLIKGQDDMRVDAVMQQVFTIMNKLLSENKKASKRKLLIRTYKVVPLSQRSGVLEWCTNTISLGEYLCIRPPSIGAHRRFRPNDMGTDKARIKIEKARITPDSNKIKTFEAVCRELKPVFRYFFVEKFPLPTMWFERKLAYTHSVAVMSMVGYILGIGDRHVQNMLIDEKTAEIIHIDFGIAFDQGQNLNCPELIPFRLTRDIEDGMGIFSIDGIFRRCCEQTLEVLRENSDIIRTASEVFIHDPLYQWILTPEKKASLQNPSNNPTNSVAEVSITASRALSRIKLKLQGLEEGTATTVEGQVNRLIQQAKDVRNLSKLFCGWQAYL